MRVFFLLVCGLMLSTAFAQNREVEVELVLFTKKQGYQDELFASVFIVSHSDDSILIDDSRDWINCANFIGVKINQQRLVDSCYQNIDQSDCHPIGESGYNPVTRILLPHETYSYIVSLAGISTWFGKPKPVHYVHKRYRLQLPYSVSGRDLVATSEWVYFSLPR